MLLPNPEAVEDARRGTVDIETAPEAEAAVNDGGDRTYRLTTVEMEEGVEEGSKLKGVTEKSRMTRI